MPQTDTLSVPAVKIIEQLEKAWKALGLNHKDDIYYGDETRIPRFPAITVDPVIMDSVPTSTQMRMTNEITVYIYLYEGSLKNMSVKKKERDERAEAIRDQIHLNRTLDGLVAHGNIVSIEPGVSALGQELLLSSRLQWQGVSKTEL